MRRIGITSGSTKGAPSAPTIGTATAGNAQATVTFTAPSFSKLPITSYTVTSSPGGITGTGASSPITVTSLTNGTAYTFTVTATNANGTSTASSQSGSVTPIDPTFMARVTQDYNLSIECSHTDSSGNIYITGSLYGTADTGQRYAYVAKLTSSGSIVWQKKFAYYAVAQNTRSANGRAVWTDSSGNVYAVSTDMPADNYASYEHPQVYKFDSNGNLLWQRRYDNPADPAGTPKYFIPYDAIVDSSSNLYFASGLDGTSAGTTNQDFGITKVDSTGAHQWSYYYSYTGDSGSGNVLSSISIDSSSNLLTVGSYPTSTRVSKFETVSHSTWSILKASSSGSVVWTRKFYDYSKFHYGTSVAVDSLDNVYSVGYSDITGIFNAYIVKHNSSGVLQWQRRIQGTSGTLYAQRCAVDSSDNLYVICTNPDAFTSLVIVKYNGSGAIQWQRSLTLNNQSVSIREFSISGNNIIFSSGYGVSSNLYTNGFVIKIPTDGSKTGTYSVGGHSYVYAVSTLTESSASLSEASDSLSANSSNVSAVTSTADVTSSSLSISTTSI